MAFVAMPDEIHETPSDVVRNKLGDKMKKVTLKLTKEEFAILDNENLSHRGIGLPFTYIDTRSKGIDILDVDKFREFLNDEIKTYVDIYNKLSKQGIREYNILKSVLSKLEEEK